MPRAPLSLAVRFPHEVVSFATSTAGTVFVRLRGEFDGASSARLIEILDAAAALGDGDVVVDVRQVSFMDSATIRVFETTAAALASDARNLVLRSPSTFVQRLLDLCGASVLIDVVLPPAAPPRTAIDRPLRRPVLQDIAANM